MTVMVFYWLRWTSSDISKKFYKLIGLIRIFAQLNFVENVSMCRKSISVRILCHLRHQCQVCLRPLHFNISSGVVEEEREGTPFHQIFCRERLFPKWYHDKGNCDTVAFSQVCLQGNAKSMVSWFSGKSWKLLSPDKGRGGKEKAVERRRGEGKGMKGKEGEKRGGRGKEWRGKKGSKGQGGKRNKRKKRGEKGREGKGMKRKEWKKRGGEGKGMKGKEGEKREGEERNEGERRGRGLPSVSTVSNLPLHHWILARIKITESIHF